MKTAMKKLLSLMLVAVLLVSAVPFQASAEVLGDSGDDLIVNQSNDGIIDPQDDGGSNATQTFTTNAKVYVDDQLFWSNNDLTVANGQTLSAVLVPHFPSDYSTAKYTVSVYTKSGNQQANGNWTVDGASEISAYLITNNVNVTVKFLNDNGVTLAKKYDAKVTLNAALLTEFGKSVPNGKKIDGWSVDGNSKSTGTAITLKGDTVITCLLADDSTNTGGSNNGGSNNGGSNNGGSNTATTVAFVVKVDGNTQTVNGSQTQYVTPSEGKGYVVVSNLIKYYFDQNWTTKYNFSHYWISGEGTHEGDNALNDQIPVGKEIHVALTTKGTTTYTVKFFNATNSSNPVKSYTVKKGESVSLEYVKAAASAATPTGYTFLGWKPEDGINNATIYSNDWVSKQAITAKTNFYAVIQKNTTNNDDNGSSGKFTYDVYLHIYAKGNVSTPIKTVNLTSGNWNCVKDDVITLDEVKDVVKSFYTAKNSDGIGYDGIYYSTSTTKTDYVLDKNSYTKISNLDELRKEGYVHLNVWIDNYKAKTSSDADPSNPKTGDTIIMTVTVMGLSTAALAAVYYISKKRAVR